MALHRCIFRIRPVKGRIFYLSGLIILFRVILLITVVSLICTLFTTVSDYQQFYDKIAR